MDLLSLFQWCENSGVGQTIRDSPWAFAAIESVHLLALAMIGGAVLLVDMRLLKILLPERAVAELAREARPWFNRSLVVMIVSGIGLFFSEATKCYYSTPFSVKMGSLFLALVFTYTIRWRVVSAEEGRFGRGTQSLVALVSLALWFGVGSGGRWIGFSG